MTDTYRVKKSEYSSSDPSTYIDIDLGGVNNTSTDLTLVGRTREYGEQYNQNILHLLENFASPEVSDTRTYSIYHAVPDVLLNPVDGQTWFNTTRKINYAYFRGRWIPQSYAGSTAANWGTVLSGVALPRPVGRDGYVFPYAECAWVVAPTYIPSEIKAMTCSVNGTTGVVSATYTPPIGAVQPMEVFYQIIGIKANDYLGGNDATSLRVILNKYLIEGTVPPTNTFPATIYTPTASPAVVTVTGTPAGRTLRYTWIRVSPSAATGFPAGYVIQPVVPNAATTRFSITINSPGVFTATDKITRGATFVCKVEVMNGTTVESTKLSLPIRIEFHNF